MDRSQHAGAGGASPTAAAASANDSSAATMRQHHALKFLVGKSPAPRNISAVDQDIAAWLLMNSDLFPNQARRDANPNTAEDDAVHAAALAAAASAGMASPTSAAILTPTMHTGHDGFDDVAMTNPAAAAGHPLAMPGVGGDASASPALVVPKVEQTPRSTGDPVVDKRQRRLEKNREIARNCRKRKRARMQELEEQVKTLTEANQRLQLRVQKTNDLRRKEDKRVQMLQRIQEMTRGGASEQEIAKAISSYKDLFADYGKNRQAAVVYHLEQLRMLLLPTQVTKMCMWSLHQDDEFYDEEKNQTSWGGGIWNILCKELNITTEQKRSLMGLRAGIKAQRNRLRRSLRMLNDLEHHVKAGVDSLESEMLQLMKCVTPMQQARFLLWIENNQACMHMLNNLWKADPRPSPSSAAGRGDTSPSTVASDSSMHSGGGSTPTAGPGLTVPLMMPGQVPGVPPAPGAAMPMMHVAPGATTPTGDAGAAPVAGSVPYMMAPNGAGAVPVVPAPGGAVQWVHPQYAAMWGVPATAFPPGGAVHMSPHMHVAASAAAGAMPSPTTAQAAAVRLAMPPVRGGAGAGGGVGGVAMVGSASAGAGAGGGVPQAVSSGGGGGGSGLSAGGATPAVSSSSAVAAAPTSSGPTATA